MLIRIFGTSNLRYKPNVATRESRPEALDLTREALDLLLPTRMGRYVVDLSRWIVQVRLSLRPGSRRPSPLARRRQLLLPPGGGLYSILDVSRDLPPLVESPEGAPPWNFKRGFGGIAPLPTERHRHYYLMGGAISPYLWRRRGEIGDGMAIVDVDVHIDIYVYVCICIYAYIVYSVDDDRIDPVRGGP